MDKMEQQEQLPMRFSVKKLLSVAGLLLTSHCALAAEVSGVQVDEQIVMADTKLQLNGAGVRSKFFMDLYVASLYVTQPAHNLADVIANPQAIIRLNITSGLITSDKIRAAIIDGFDAATAGSPENITAQITKFTELFDDTVRNGDQFTFVTRHPDKVITYKNGQHQAQIEGKAFREALLGIWLGDEPAQNSLKADMLASN